MQSAHIAHTQMPVQHSTLQPFSGDVETVKGVEVQQVRMSINSDTHTTQMYKHLIIPPFSYPGQSSAIHIDVLSNVRPESYLCFLWGLDI